MKYDRMTGSSVQFLQKTEEGYYILAEYNSLLPFCKNKSHACFIDGCVENTKVIGKLTGVQYLA